MNYIFTDGSLSKYTYKVYNILVYKPVRSVSQRYYRRSIMLFIPLIADLSLEYI
jgi:hypothetical protein